MNLILLHTRHLPEDHEDSLPFWEAAKIFMYLQILKPTQLTTRETANPLEQVI